MRNGTGIGICATLLGVLALSYQPKVREAEIEEYSPGVSLVAYVTCHEDALMAAENSAMIREAIQTPRVNGLTFGGGSCPIVETIELPYQAWTITRANFMDDTPSPAFLIASP